MSPPPFDLNDWFDTESDSDVPGSDEEDEDTEGIILEDDNDEDWEDEPSGDEDSDEDDDSTDGKETGHDGPTEKITVPPLLPVPISLKKTDQKLCSTCKMLGLKPRRFVVLPGDPETGDESDDDNIQLGLIADIKKKALSCPFCRLVIAALGPRIPLVADNGMPVFVTMTWNTDGPSKRQPCIRILRPYAQTKKGGYLNDLKTVNLLPEITMLANDAPSRAKRTLLLRLIKEQIDFGIVRNWLNICRIQHGSACDQSDLMEHGVEDPARDIPFFRLIDVVDNNVVLAPSGCKYVALSYVWGNIDPNAILRTLKSNYKGLEKPGALLLPENEEKIPITIRDAMQVVRELNFRYLWVDSLCIIQDDVGPGGSKMSAIAKMDLVYGAAYLTIYAATGTDANAGLPGVRPNTRGTKQQVEEVLPGLRLGVKPRSQNDHLHSIYYTRAWTYQEREFTKRSLVFTGGQVVYSCVKAEEWREDVLFEDQKMKEKEATFYDGDDIIGFEGSIGTYSKLSLTFETDIYDAFAGMNRYFKRSLRVNLVHGIPDAFFDWFLLWDAVEVQKRRDKTPSWSWSGWIGESWLHMWHWYNRSVVRVRIALRKRTWIIWYQRRAHNSEEVVRVWVPKRSSKPTSKPRNFYGGHTEDRFPMDCSRTTPTPRKLTGAPKYIEDAHHPAPGSGFLQFWTVSLVFKIGKPRSSVDPKIGLITSNTRLGIYGRSNRELGIVYLHPEWAKANMGKDHEFIVICEGRDKRAKDADAIDEEDGWRYKVMLIEWTGDWAERVSIGSIGKGDLKQSVNEPRWKEIILG